MLTGELYFKKFRFYRALRTYDVLNREYPKTPAVLDKIAECHLQLGNFFIGLRTFEDLRIIDPLSTRGLDLYAMLLERHGTPAQLNELGKQILQLKIQNSAQAWTALSLFWKAKGSKEKAMSMIEVALTVDPDHARAHLLKGQLLLDQNKPSEAVESFRLAQMSNPSFQAYRGLVACKFKLSDPHGALHVATELRQRMFDNPRAITLYADLIHRVDPSKIDASFKLFQSALDLDPSCIDAILSMASLYAAQQKHDDAIHLLLSKVAAVYESDRGLIWFQLGKLYDAKGMLTDALKYLENAHAILPAMKEISESIEALKEKVHRAESSNAGDSDVEEEDDDEEDGQFEEPDGSGDEYA